MCPIGEVCITFSTHIILLSLAVAGCLVLLTGLEPEDKNKPPQSPVEDLRRKWKDKMPRK